LVEHLTVGPKRKCGATPQGPKVIRGLGDRAPPQEPKICCGIS